MATKTYATGDPEVVKLWSKRMAREALKATVIASYIKDSADALVTLETDTQKSAGDRVTVTLRYQFTGDGVGENETQEGNEEAIRTATDNLVINELSHAFRHKSKVAQQRVPFKMAKEGNTGLADWWANRIDYVAFAHLGGYTPANALGGGVGKYNGFNTITAPTAGRHLWTEAGTSDDQSLDSTGDEFTLAMIDKAVELAETGGSTELVPIRKIKGLPGGAEYVCFIHPTQGTSLRTSTTTNNWMDLQKALLNGGKGDESMIWKGSFGVYNRTLLVSNNRVPHGVNSSTGAAITTVKRAIFCGAQALITAYGQGFGPEEWEVNEETFDFKRQYAMNGLNIFGFKKSVFTPPGGSAGDFATIVLSSYAAAAA